MKSIGEQIYSPMLNGALDRGVSIHHDVGHILGLSGGTGAQT
jgi:hypothetical protein